MLQRISGTYSQVTENIENKICRQFTQNQGYFLFFTNDQ